MSELILVINPNSTESCTAAIDRAMDPFRLQGGPKIECVTLKAGPPSIETQAHVASVVPHLLDQAAKREDAGLLVVACFSDPGLHELWEVSGRSALGIAECGLLTACTLGGRFGIIAIKSTSIPRHMRYVRSLGLTDRLAGDRAVGLSVPELADEGITLDRMIETARMLRDQDGAEVLVMGCGGMANYRDRLQDAIGVPVVEPSQAAAGMAIGALRRGW